MLAPARRLGLLRWLLRELSIDDEDMIAFVASLPDADDDDLQALVEALEAPGTEATSVGLRAEHEDDNQLVVPIDARRILNLSGATVFALLKRGVFPHPVRVHG